MSFIKIYYNIKKIALNFLEYKNWINISITILKGKNPKKVVLKNDVQIEGPENNILLQGVYEIFYKNDYTTYSPIEINDIVVDVGANVGIFSLFAATKTHNIVYAIEPFPDNFNYLKRNVHTNGLENIKIYNIALCDKIGCTDLFIDDESGGHLLNPIVGNSKKCIEVSTTTLKQFMDKNNIQHIDFLKLDCEGSEGLILESTPIEYLKKIEKIAMEFHDNASPLNHNDIIKLLEDSGFATKLDWDGKSYFGYIYGKRN